MTLAESQSLVFNLQIAIPPPPHVFDQQLIILPRHAVECTLQRGTTCVLRLTSQPETHVNHPTAKICDGSVSTDDYINQQEIQWTMVSKKIKGEIIRQHLIKPTNSMEQMDLEKLTCPQLVKEFHAFYAARRFITAFI